LSNYQLGHKKSQASRKTKPSCPSKESLHENRPIHSFSRCFPHTRSDHRGYLNCHTSRPRPKSRLAPLSPALEGLLLSALPGLLKLLKGEESEQVFCSSYPAVGVMDRGKAKSAPEGLHNLVEFEFH